MERCRKTFLSEALTEVNSYLPWWVPIAYHP